MNPDQLHALWGGQSPAHFNLPDPADCQRSLTRELKRRQRMLAYETFSLAFGAVALPVLSFLNFRYLPAVGTWLYWLSLAAHLAITIVLLIGVIRRIGRHRTLARKSTETLRQQTEAALANLEAEMREYRAIPMIFALFFGLNVLSLWVNTPFHGGGAMAIGVRLAIIVGLYGLTGAVLARNYRANLRPAHQRQKELLSQLS